jgi:2-keto-4-pentenoate hydratase/2-oxohepta-3-ene-1,7-dioic acid hydratase in catechol pathway
MRLVTYASTTGPRIATRVGQAYVDLQQADPSLPTDIRALLEEGPAALARAERAAARGSALPTDPLRLLAPVPQPEKIFCIGLNYADHAAESGLAPPTEPVVFSKFATAVRGNADPIVLPHASAKVDYEAELVVVVGRGGRDIPRERALEHVAGYTCGHDVSARDWQLEKPGGQWLLGKTFDSFAPFGPELVTPDEVGDAGRLAIALRLNGQTMQQSNTSQLIFPIDHLIAYLSTVCTLCPGDIIFTGTPPGVGMARKPPVFLKPGDVAEVEIERIGVLRNPVVAAS